MKIKTAALVSRIHVFTCPNADKDQKQHYARNIQQKLNTKRLSESFYTPVQV